MLRWTGDGLKADFPTASAAVAAAIDMQRSVGDYSRSDDAVSPFQIRIGLAVGEVVVEGNETHGIAVIEAARLEPLASPGDILATDLVRRLGQRRSDAGFEEVGSFDLKGLERPVSVVRVVDTAANADGRPLPRSLSRDRRFPLVGRSDEVASALDRWKEVQDGSAAVVLVAGQPGLGKSRLLTHVASAAHAAGALVIAGACDGEVEVPYQPFATAFAETTALDGDLATAVTEGDGPLGPLFPARRAGRFQDPRPSARLELFEAVGALLGRLTEDQPLVLVLEDLQWADVPTVELLRHLVHQTTHSRLLVLASYRPEEIGPTHPLHGFLLNQRLSFDVTQLDLDLDPLRAEEVEQLVAARVPFAPDEGVHAFAGRVCAESAGSPFFVCELLDHLTTTGELERLVEHGAGDELPIPDSVREVVGQRLGRMPTATTAMLATASVVGAAFDLELLANVVGEDEELVLTTCEGAARAALLAEVGVGRVAFAHSIVRTTVLEGLSVTRQALLHRHIAQGIEALQRSDHDELARHWTLAGDQEKANESIELAARRHMEALAYESAADRYQRLLDFHQSHPSDDLAPLARAWLGLGLARRAMGLPSYLSCVEEAGRLGRRLRDPELIVDAALASIWPGNLGVATAGRVDDGVIELTEDALAVLDADDPGRSRVLCTLAGHLTYSPDRARRAALLREALEHARTVGDPGLIGNVLVAEHLTMWDPTTQERRAAIVEELAPMARSSGDADLEFFAGFFAAFSAAEAARVAEARRRLEDLEPEVKASANPYFAFLRERLLVSLDLFTGAPEVQASIDALAERHSDIYADTDGTWAVQSGVLARQLGTLHSAASALEQMIANTAIPGNWSPGYGLALLAGGDRDGAAAQLERLDEPPLDYLWLVTTQTTAELSAGLGDQARCRQLFDALVPYRGLLGITASGSAIFSLVSLTLGELALTLEEHDVAVDLLQEAAAQAEQIGAPFDLVKSQRLLATTLHAIGRGEAEVRPLVDAATALAAELGYGGELRALAELQSELVSSGEPGPSAGRSRR